jgi:hypothetical protein|tara:strand:+ start:227 stop:451 length:225 start_codon:yes stop_codon:yes gene_type:complete
MNEMLLMQPHLEFDSRFSHLMGQRVEALDESGMRHAGRLGFVGFNSIFGCFQLTLDKCPTFNIVPSSIKLHKNQ